MANSKRHLDMRMRLLDDGGPLFALMDAIPETGRRNERIRQLAYLGLMVEKGALGLVMGMPRDTPSANSASFDSPVTPSKRSQRTKNHE